MAKHKHGIHYYDLINALEILRRKNQGVLTDIQQERRYGPRKTLIDTLYVLTPHPRFIRQAKLANKRARWLLEASS